MRAPGQSRKTHVGEKTRLKHTGDVFVALEEFGSVPAGRCPRTDASRYRRSTTGASPWASRATDSRCAAGRRHRPVGRDRSVPGVVFPRGFVLLGVRQAVPAVLTTCRDARPPPQVAPLLLPSHFCKGPQRLPYGRDVAVQCGLLGMPFARGLVCDSLLRIENLPTTPQSANRLPRSFRTF